MKVDSDCLVEFAYRLFDGAGQVVEDSADDGNITYLHGHDEIQPRLEEALSGRSPGDQFRVVLEADEGFGRYDPEQIIALPRSELPPDAEVVPGDWLSVSMREEDHDESEEDDEVEMRVVKVQPETVFLDANHPLAGQQVTFEIRVLAVRTATPAEISARLQSRDPEPEA